MFHGHEVDEQRAAASDPSRKDVGRHDDDIRASQATLAALQHRTAASCCRPGSRLPMRRWRRRCSSRGAKSAARAMRAERRKAWAPPSCSAAGCGDEGEPGEQREHQREPHQPSHAFARREPLLPRSRGRSSRRSPARRSRWQAPRRDPGRGPRGPPWDPPSAIRSLPR